MLIEALLKNRIFQLYWPFSFATSLPATSGSWLNVYSPNAVKRDLCVIRTSIISLKLSVCIFFISYNVFETVGPAEVKHDGTSSSHSRGLLKLVFEVRKTYRLMSGKDMFSKGNSPGGCLVSSALSPRAVHVGYSGLNLTWV